MMKLGVSVVAAAAAAAGLASALLLRRKQSPSPKTVHADRRVGFSLLLPLPAQDHFDDNMKPSGGMMMQATKLNNVEDQCLVLEKEIISLKLEKENLIVERSSLISQVDSSSQKLARVENKHAQLEIKQLNLEKENALRVHEVLELESLLKLENVSLEDSQEENSQLTVIDNLKIQIKAQRTSLISQVDSMSQKLARVENRHAELVINHLNLEKENESKLDHLERENRGLRAYLDAYLPLVTSLQGSIVSLKEQTLSLIRHPASFNQESEEIFLGSYQKLDNNFLGEHPTPMVPSGVLEMQKLIAKFGEHQKVITDTAALLAKERLDHNADLEAARKEIREIKAQKSSLIS